MDRTMIKSPQQQQAIKEMESAKLAAEMFDHFCSAGTMRQTMGLFRNICDTIGLRPGPINEFYPQLKTKIKSWKAQALWKKFDARAVHRIYNKGSAANGTRVLVIGAGPCGLRTAIEAQFLGAKVVVVEKRDRISRNNVLHLWPFVITDLRLLGAKKFYGKFCAGSIDHISIRQLQCILLKVALLLGVEIHEGVSFEHTLEPSDGCGWRAQTIPEDHPVSHYEFDVLIGADGKRNTLKGFNRKELRGKLAIAITANFINKRTEAEARAEEISGVAFIFNQSFFKELYNKTGIDLENIVYYKDDTHYFVMTAKKHSLLDKGVIIQDYADPAELLSLSNVNRDRLYSYAREAAEFSTKYQMPNLEFAVNHFGNPDVAMFDFTSMFSAENSCRVEVKRNYRLLQCLVGDSLLEPFWPTGSGCARGFLSSMDSAYAIKLWSNPKNSILAVIAQRESIYRLLAQTTPENLHRDIGAYTLDPSTRYPNLNKSAVNVYQVKHLIETDDPELLEQTFIDTSSLQVIPEVPLKRKRTDTLPLSTVLLRWIKAQLKTHEFTQNLTEVSECFTNGHVLVTLINRYRPDLVDLNSLTDRSNIELNGIAFRIIANELHIPAVMSAEDSITLENVDPSVWMGYLEQVCELFRGEIPHIKHPKLDFAELKEKTSASNKAPDFSRLLKFNNRKESPMRDVPRQYDEIDRDRSRRSRSKLIMESNVPGTGHESSKRARKRRSHEKSSINIDRERGIPSSMPRNALDEQFNDRIKSMEQRITTGTPMRTDKKPKDLLRKIGKIESTDWNIREIERKMEESKKPEVGKSFEKVPKWSKEQFQQLQNKMAQAAPEQESTDERFKEIEQTIKNVDKQLKDSALWELRERGKNKVASLAGSFVKKDNNIDAAKSIPRSNSKAGLSIPFNPNSGSEVCHFCKQKVYHMEKSTAENLVFHRSCLKCHHCHANLRLGGYAYDRDDPDGKFYCTQHFRLPAKILKPIARRPMRPLNAQEKSPSASISATLYNDKMSEPKQTGISNLDLLDRGQTQERIEFENVDPASDGEPSLGHIIDENEWTDRNFGTATEEESELSSSESESDIDSDSENFEEAIGSPLGAQTLQLANDWIGRQRYTCAQDSDDGDFYDSTEDEEVESQSEGEEMQRAREIRRQEVKLKPLPYLPTDTETEIQSDGESSSSDERENSATEISTDSEFERDTMVRSPPNIYIDDSHLRRATRVQVKQGVINNGLQKSFSSTNPTQCVNEDIVLNFKPLIQVDPTIMSSTRQPLKNPLPGNYLLNKTPSTEGIASKRSLELKKQYLLGDNGKGIGLMKSDSTSVLDSKLKNFHSNISECQKLLNPSNEISPSMQSFLTVMNRKSQNRDETSSSHTINSSEKENAHKNLELTKNELNKVSEPVTPIAETVNIVLVGNKMKDMPIPSVIDGIDLDKIESKPLKSILHRNSESLPPNIVNQNKEFIAIMDTSDKLIDVIDLTKDTSIDDAENLKDNESEKEQSIKSLKETVPDIIKESFSKSVSIEEQPLIDTSIGDSRPRSPVHERIIEVPYIPWDKKPKQDIVSDSLSSTTSSSLEEIPHFVLDSTTSPDTQPIIPRVEVRNTSGELMQVDSLMIVNGEYIGDPEDLKNINLPDGTKISDSKPVAVVKPESPKEEILSHTFDDSNVTIRRNRNYSDRQNKPFDTKNENKINTLRNIPLIIPRNLANQIKPIKPNSLELARKASEDDFVDLDKTPTAATINLPSMQNKEATVQSDSETERTGSVCTETEMSDWAADDAVSENFFDIEFAMNSNKGTIKRNKKRGSTRQRSKLSSKEIVDSAANEIKKRTPRKASIEMEDDSLIMISSQGTTTAPTLSTTADDSDALTVVTSPLDSNMGISSLNSEHVEHGATIKKKLSQKSATLGGAYNRDEPLEKISIDKNRRNSQDDILKTKKDVEEMNYEDYVRQLQKTITQISNATDSLEIRKSKRRSGKPESSEANSKNGSTKNLTDYSESPTQMMNNSPPTVTKKLEEISKERIKQKDLIHDLVMDKLQNKKNLNAEKRLNRSRNRAVAFSTSNGTVSILSPNTSMDTNDCRTSSPIRRNSTTRLNNENLIEKTAISSETPIVQFKTPSPTKLAKAQSFCVYSTRQHISSNPMPGPSMMMTPHRYDRIEGVKPVSSFRHTANDPLMSTDKMREEARARARLKTDQELGLSPEEKIQILRNRYKLNFATPNNALNKSDDMKVKERKMMTSKSVNDITAVQHELNSADFTSDPNLADNGEPIPKPRTKRSKDPERRRSLIQAVSEFFHKRKEKDSNPTTPTNKDKNESVFNIFSKISPKSKSKEKDPATYPRSKSENCLKPDLVDSANASQKPREEEAAPPIPPLPLNYERSDDESNSVIEPKQLKKMRAMSKASKQAELKRLRIAQEIQFEQEVIEIKLKELEARGVLIEKALRGEAEIDDGSLDPNLSMGERDKALLKKLWEIYSNVTELMKQDKELDIRQQELQLEHRHAQLKEELNMRLSTNKLNKSTSDVAAEGAILNEMLEIVAKRASLRPVDAIPLQSTSQDTPNDSNI